MALKEAIKNLYLAIKQDIDKHVEYYINGEAKGSWKLPDILEEKDELMKEFCEKLEEDWETECEAYHFFFTYKPEAHYQIKMEVHSFNLYPECDGDADNFVMFFDHTFDDDEESDTDSESNAGNSE